VTETEIEAAEIVRLRFTERLCSGLLESVTVKVSEMPFALALGVPEIAPVDELSKRAAGRVPLVSDHL
jgi:hypothetical protein